MSSAALPEAPTATPVTTENRLKGVLYALIAPVLGVIAWLILWQFGFLAAAVAWLIAALTIYFYRLGAGAVSRRSVPAIIGIIAFGVVAAFLSGMVYDALPSYLEEIGGTATGALLSLDFWLFFGINLLYPELWTSYLLDILISVAFAVLGSYGTIKQLLHETKAPAPQTTAAEPASEQPATKPAP